MIRVLLLIILALGLWRWCRHRWGWLIVYSWSSRYLLITILNGCSDIFSIVIPSILVHLSLTLHCHSSVVSTLLFLPNIILWKQGSLLGLFGLFELLGLLLLTWFRQQRVINCSVINCFIVSLLLEFLLMIHLSYSQPTS